MGFGQVNESSPLEAIERARLHESADIPLSPGILLVRCKLTPAARLLWQRRAVKPTLQGAAGLQQLRRPFRIGQWLPLNPFEQERGAASSEDFGEMTAVQKPGEAFDPLGMTILLETSPFQNEAVSELQTKRGTLAESRRKTGQDGDGRKR
jgi:hypothetical protein